MTDWDSKLDPRTQLIHHPYVPPAQYAAPQPGVFKASTVFFPTAEAMRTRRWMDKSGYTYGLHGTPTSYLLEERLCALEGGLQCLLVPSGLAALGLVALSLLKTGDEVLIPDNAYGPNKAIAEGELRNWGITHQYYDPMDPEDLEAQISSRTKLVWLEAAGSVTLEFPNLLEMVRVCQRRKVLTALDNTWGAGLAFRPFDLDAESGPHSVGVDISTHALTKYPSGGGDVLMGSVITRNAALHHQLKLTHMRFGFGVGMNDVESVLRSLPSMALRYQAHDAATRTLARWAQKQPEFVQVLHPALETSPGHQDWKALCGSAVGTAAGLFSVIIDACYPQHAVDAFCDALRLFKLGYSWGGPISLVVPYELETMRTTWPAHLAKGTLVRFSIGLEEVADLQADLMQALEAMHQSLLASR
ncbi:PLP-dependent transferase [Curvibacter sp. CHRR-16]|uniref:PLP-dependent transferase n=1 Tax=Curvibacter sp. CHRR-16 TaxID=2835872 RepID=UPI001BD9C12D|nr:PLP-dependent transferase [Curvibacter sp. CHRR-16]MBT0571193.1 PLP-dependent transferase [Curvibacter sp. CHRR-16]